MATFTLPVTVTAQIFASGKYSDLTISCQGREFKVHRNVVCLQSNVIANKVDELFKDSPTGVLDLPENDPDVVEKMIQFLYLGEYPGAAEKVEKIETPTIEAPEPPLLVSEVDGSVIRKNKKKKKKNSQVNGTNTSHKSISITESALILHAHVYAIAEQYDVPTLKTYVTQKYEEAISTWNASDFVESLKVIYRSTPDSDRGLKDIAIRTAAEYTSDLCERPEFAALCRENGDVAFNVLKASLAGSRGSSVVADVEKFKSPMDEKIEEVEEFDHL